MLDVSYIGNRGSRLNHHWQTLGVDANMNDPSVLALGTPVLQSDINSDLARERRHPVAVSGLQRQRGAGAAEVSAVPEHHLARRADRRESVPRARARARAALLAGPPGARRLHLLAAEEQRRRERARATTASTAACRIPPTRCRGGLSADDTPHVFLVGLHLGDAWPESGTSGPRPARRLERQRHPPLRKRPAAEHHHEQRSRAACSSTARSGPTARRAPTPSPQSGDFDPITDNYFNRDAWTDPGPLQFGNAPRARRHVRGFPTYSEDINIFKVFQARRTRRCASRRVRQHLSTGRLFCDPNTNWSSPAFGTVNTQCNQPRSIQFAFRFDF